MSWNNPVRPSRRLAAGLPLIALLLMNSGAAGVEPATCPVYPGQPGWLEDQMQQREKSLSRFRQLAIDLLQAFLVSEPDAAQRADALYRLAELMWEQAETRLLADMRTYEEQLELFKNGSRPERPVEPRIDLAASIRIYEELLEKHPDFDRTDTVLYLYGFALNEQGDEETALSIYRSLLKRFPSSVFVPDAHLAIGEYQFSKAKFGLALKSYLEVLKHPDSPLEDLAAYKTAWCYFKEGDPKNAARYFKMVLRSRDERPESPPRSSQQTDLEREALEDLALTFSESGGAKEAYRFMSQVGGQEYSIRVLKRLGDVFFDQARFVEAIDSYQMLVEKFPMAVDNPQNQLRIAQAWDKQGKPETGLQARQKLARLFGPRSEWVKDHRDDPEALKRAHQLSEQALRFVALYRHKQAQQSQDKADYARAAEAYHDYLRQFSGSPEAAQMHSRLGDVRYKLEDYSLAADNYIKARDQLKDESLRKDAAYAAVLSFEKMIPKDEKGQPEPPVNKLPLSTADQGFIDAVDAFIKLAPEDPRVVPLRFQVGRVTYQRGQFDQAAVQLRSLVEQNPRHALSEAAADLALDCYNRSGHFGELEKWARQLLQAGVFAGSALGKQLPDFIAGAIFQHGSQLAKNGDFAQAAEEFRRLATEFSGHELAPQALFMTGVALDKLGEKQQSVKIYEQVIAQYPDRAADATFVVAGIYERQYDYDRAAEEYDRFAQRFPRDPRAPEALLQAASLRHALKAHDSEARLLARFTKDFADHKQAPEALFRSGLAQALAGEHGLAERTFRTYLKKYAARLGHVREATLHLGLAMLSGKRTSQARKQFERCGSPARRAAPQGSELEAAAHCRFMLAELVFHDYERIRLKPPMRVLVKRLKQKAALLKTAQGLFTKVVQLGHLEWASAALFRIGDMYARFARSIYDAPMPRRLSQQETEVYRQELQSLAFPIEDKALTAFTYSHQTTIRSAYFSRWSERTIDMLRTLDPAKYPKEEELRPGEAWADSFTSFPLLLNALPVPELPPASPEKADEP